MSRRLQLRSLQVARSFRRHDCPYGRSESLPLPDITPGPENFYNLYIYPSPLSLPLYPLR